MYTCLSYTRIVATYMNSSYTRRIVIHELGARARAKTAFLSYDSSPCRGGLA